MKADTCRAALCREKREKIIREFGSLKQKLDEAVTVSSLKIAEQELEAVKNCLLDELAAFVPPMPDTSDTPKIPDSPVPGVAIKKQKNVSVRSMIRLARIETPDDVEKFVGDLRSRLISELSDDTTLIVS